MTNKLANKTLGKKTHKIDPFGFDWDLDLPSAGTAPFNEVEALHDRQDSQRHPNESSDTDNAPNLADFTARGSTPDGFKWVPDDQGGTKLVALSEAKVALALLIERYYEDKDTRRFLMKEDAELAKSMGRFFHSIKSSQIAATLG